MSPIESISTCIRKYIDFSGRAQRSEYWWFLLFRVIVGIAVGWIPLLGGIVGLLLLLPSLAVQARRLHDTNRSAWWLLTLVPPITPIGVIVLLIMSIFPGTIGPNQYGPNPLQPNMGMGGYGYAGPGDPYAPTPLGGTATEADPEPSGRLYCSQCGAERQPDARFCIVCGANF